MPAYWRILETEIVRIARRWDGELTEGKTGDKLIVFACNDDANAYEINLTELAQELSRASGMQP